MNIHASRLHVAGPEAQPPSPPRPEARPAQARITPLGAVASAVSFDLPQGAGRGRIDGEIGGRPLPRPVVSTALPLRRGGLRQLVLLRIGPAELAGIRCLFRRDGAPAAALDPDWLQPPEADAADLVDGLAEEGRRRLARLLLGAGAGLLGAAGGPGFGSALGDLLARAGAAERAPEGVFALGGRARIWSFALPGADAATGIGRLWAVGPDRAAALTGFSAHLEAVAGGALLHLFLPAPPPAGTLAASLAGEAAEALLLAAPAEAEPRPLAAWMERRPAEARRWAEARVAEAAAADRAARALLAELRCPPAAEPRFELQGLWAAPRGVLALGTLHDPHGLAAGIAFGRDGVEAVLPLSPGRPTEGAVGGFAPLPPGADPSAPCRLRVVYASGRVRVLGEVRPEPLPATPPEGLCALPDAAEALAAARRGLRRPETPLETETIGAVTPVPRLALVVPAGTDPDLIRARAAMIAREPGAARLELLYVAGPAAAAPLRRLLGETAAVFGLGCRLAVAPADADPAAALRAALGATRAPAALVTAADVIPEGPGWLAAWVRALGRRGGPALLGGTLLGADGATLAAGDPRLAGLPASALPRGASGPAAEVAADCVGLGPAALAALAVWEAHDTAPEAVFVGLAARLARRGLPPRVLRRGRFRAFAPRRAPDALAAAADARACAALIADDAEGGMA